MVRDSRLTRCLGSCQAGLRARCGQELNGIAALAPFGNVRQALFRETRFKSNLAGTGGLLPVDPQLLRPAECGVGWIRAFLITCQA